MKIFSTIALGLIVFAVTAQDSQKVKLNWKIGKQDTIICKTIMSELDPSSLKVDFNTIFKDSSDNFIEKAKEKLREINKSLYSNLITILTSKKNGVIDILMVSTTEKEETKNNEEENWLTMIKAANSNAMLRGSVYTTGEIHSFWTIKDQKNTIALLFELPSYSVQVGDSWPLDVNFLSTDQNFVCDSSYKRNKASLTGIKQINGDNIAVLKYDIEEYVSEIKVSPLSHYDDSKVNIMMKYIAIGEFSIDKGRWISYDGIIDMQSSGAVNGNTRTKLALIPNN